MTNAQYLAPCLDSTGTGQPLTTLCTVQYMALCVDFVFGFSVNYLLNTVSLQESVQVVQPFLGSAKEAILLRDALLTLTSSPGVDHYLQVSAEVRTSLQDVNLMPNQLSIDFTLCELQIVNAFYHIVCVSAGS